MQESDIAFVLLDKINESIVRSLLLTVCTRCFESFSMFGMFCENCVGEFPSFSCCTCHVYKCMKASQEMKEKIQFQTFDIFLPLDVQTFVVDVGIHSLFLGDCSFILNYSRLNQVN